MAGPVRATAGVLRPPVSPRTRLGRGLLIVRAPFLLATMVGVLTGAAAVFAATGAVSWPLLGLTLLGTALLHLFANTANDYFDWRSGTDQANRDYVAPFTGGSRSLELRLVTPPGLLRLAVALLAAAAGVGGALMTMQPSAAPGILGIGLLAAAIALFYTAPPVRLAARKGLGELSLGLAFGPLLTLGTGTVLRGGVAWSDALFGLVPGLLTTAILWINQFPDIVGDRATGKLNLVASLGWRTARGGYVAILAGAAGSVVALVAAGLAPLPALAALAATPLAVRAIHILYATSSPAALRPACAATIRLQWIAGGLFVTGIVAGSL